MPTHAVTLHAPWPKSYAVGPSCSRQRGSVEKKWRGQPSRADLARRSGCASGRREFTCLGTALAKSSSWTRRLPAGLPRRVKHDCRPRFLRKTKRNILITDASQRCPVSSVPALPRAQCCPVLRVPLLLSVSSLGVRAVAQCRAFQRCPEPSVAQCCLCSSVAQCVQSRAFECLPGLISCGRHQKSSNLWRI